MWRTAPAFSELILRAEVDPTDADVQRQLDALTAFSRALSLFVDGRPGASMRTYLDVVERADFASDPWLPPAMTRTDAVAVLSVNAAKGQEFDLVIVAGCLEGALPMTARPQGLFEAWRLDGDPGPVARADALLDAERRRFTLAASRARDRVVFTASRVDGRGEPSRFLRELGLELPADPPAPDTTPLGSLEAAGALRRVAGDRDRPAAERLAAATTLAAIPGVDPATWWWRRDYTVDPEPIAAEGRLRTSYSRIGTYEDCHLRYFFGSVAGLDDRSSYQMAFGRLMHTIFELAAKGDIANEPDDLKAAYRQRFNPAWFPSRAIAYQYWRDGMGMLELWHRSEAEAARRALRFEVGFEMEVGDHLVRGRIDRVDRGPDDGIVLLDYKTARYPASEEEAERSLQLAIYYLAALRDPELAALGHPVEMQLVYPARVMHGRFTRVSQHPGPDHAGQVERRLLALLDGAAAESFDPDPHADCRMCAFKPICPMWPQGEEFLAPAHPPSGLDAAGTSPGDPDPRAAWPGPERGRWAVSATLTGVVTPGVRAALRGQDPTPEQLAAITAPIGPVHVIAGAGSGKTAVMAARIVYLVERLGVAPASVLGLTFTNKAASELEARVREALADTPTDVGDEVTVDTYHAFAADLVKAYGIRVGVEVDADLLSEAQQYQILLGILDSERFEHLSVRTAGATIRKTLELASACADHVVPAERVVEASRRLLQRADEGERLPDWMLQAARERTELARLVERYAAEKRRRGRLDFGDQVAKAVELVEGHPELLEELRTRFQHVLLDEYQDTNVAQRRLMQRICPPGASIMAVGDARQAIYAFRGATMYNLLSFTDHFPPTPASPRSHPPRRPGRSRPRRTARSPRPRPGRPRCRCRPTSGRGRGSWPWPTR